MQQSKPLGTIAFMIDDRVSREKAQIVMRVVNALRKQAHLILLRGDTTEEALVAKLQSEDIQLVLVPWYRYLTWSKVEAFYGLTRTSGPTFAGYFADQVLPYELGEQGNHLRAILLDFANLTPNESALLVKTLAVDRFRSGLQPLLDSRTPVYCESWHGGLSLGQQMDAVMHLPEISGSDWAKRANAFRLAITALWSLVYDEGPGKGEFAQTISAKSPKAYFQCAVEPQIAAFRVCYSMSSWSPKHALAHFWPDPKKLISAAQLLLKYCDFLRVHTISDAADVEVVAGFLPSSPAERFPGAARSFWVEPLAAHSVTEIPFLAPGPHAPQLRYFPAPPSFAANVSTKNQAPSQLPEEKEARERFIFNAAIKIRDLRKALDEKDELIRELKSGGVGTAPPLPPPDADALLGAFQERYFEAKLEIRKLELQIVEAEKRGAKPKELEEIRKRIGELASCERRWIELLSETIETFKQAKR